MGDANEEGAPLLRQIADGVAELVSTMRELRAELEAYKALLPEPDSLTGRALAHRMRRSEARAART